MLSSVISNVLKDLPIPSVVRPPRRHGRCQSKLGLGHHPRLPRARRFHRFSKITPRRGRSVTCQCCVFGGGLGGSILLAGLRESWRIFALCQSELGFPGIHYFDNVPLTVQYP
ncbi:hypothetical protein I3760_10G159700 [Carya illinoinensis]|nr:hypothetical protein I3760_10G159700 [Carya illinoinensis]